jgi:uncharacterized protein
MASNAEALRDGYQAYSRGDIEAATENWQDDIQWENPNAPQLPSPGVHRGKDAVVRILNEIPEHWDDFRVSADEFIDGGDTVVALGHIEARGKQSGKDVKAPFVHVWRFSDGKVARVQVLTDTALVADALGG